MGLPDPNPRNCNDGGQPAFPAQYTYNPSVCPLFTPTPTPIGPTLAPTTPTVIPFGPTLTPTPAPQEMTPTPTRGPGLIIRGWVWTDSNQNKSKQSEEDVIVDTGLTLVGPDWKDIGIGHTSSSIGDKDKNYEFTDAKSGNYNIKYLLPTLTGERLLEPCASLVPPSPVPSDNRYFYCQEGSLVKLKQWTPGSVNPYKEVSYFPATTGIVNVDFPFITCPLKKYGDANCQGKIDGSSYAVWFSSQCHPAKGSNQKCADLRADFGGQLLKAAIPGQPPVWGPPDQMVDDDDYEIFHYYLLHPTDIIRSEY